MGTRSVSGVRIHNTDKLSYNHFDGYPSGVGAEILNELKERFQGRDYDDVLGELKQKAHSLRVVDESEKPTEDDIRKMTAEGAVNLSVSKGSVDDWDCLTREHHGSILKRLDCGIATEGNGLLNKGTWCEYGYILNLDDETLEFYDVSEKPNGNTSRYDSPLIHAYPLREFLALDGTDDMDARLEKFSETRKAA